MRWHSMHYKDVAQSLQTSLATGLKPAQVSEKQRKYGLNKLDEGKRTSLLVRYFMQFNDFMIIVLIAAAVVSFLVSFINGEKEYIDSIIILVIVMLNALLGLVQESKAEKSIEALKKMSAPTSKVIRDGKTIVVNTEDLVPGDILVLETGDFVSADARLITSANLKAEESALTGESVPVEKEAMYIANEKSSVSDRRNMVFSGSSISYGRGTAIVSDTGMSTEVGKIANMIINDEAPETPLQKKLSQTGKMLGIIALGICFGIFLLGIVRQMEAFDMFMTSVSLAVAAIPEGLPAIVTIMLAIGVQRMAKQNAIIRKLPAVETLGSATVICSDKTGTLTQNKMTVVEVCNSCGIVRSGLDNETILKYSAMCNDTTVEKSDGQNKLMGDPTEKALVQAALNIGVDKNEIEAQLPRVNEIPFDSTRKLMTTIHEKENGAFISITKGAPDVLLNQCTSYFENGEIKELTESKKKQLEEMNSQMAYKALRVLGVSFKNLSVLPHKIAPETIENNLIFAGLVGMIDPPREEVKEAVATCIEAGIKPVMITGDHVETAISVAKKLGIAGFGTKAMLGVELNEMSDEKLSEEIENCSVFARVSPEHKVRIVKAFQNKGHIVAMTGDGVNDAPALKAADIGCAMGISGTDVAKGAADMILTDDNFKTIVAAVKEGRGIYSNIKKAVHFLLSSNIGEILVMLVALLMGWQTPLLAIHLLWTNLVTDSLPAIALGLDPAEEDIMTRKPYDKTKGLFTGGLWQKIVMQGIMIGLLSLLAFGIGSVYFNTTVGRTMAFATLSISQLVHAFNMRSEKSIFAIDILGNMYLIYAFIAGVILQASVIMIPTFAKTFRVASLNPIQWLIVSGLCIVPIIVVELEKLGEAVSESKTNPRRLKTT